MGGHSGWDGKAQYPAGGAGTGHDAGRRAVIREDRELLAELARVNGDMASLGMRIIDGSASAAEQAHYAPRLIAAGERLPRRADGRGGVVIEGDVLVNEITLPEHTVELDWEP